MILYIDNVFDYSKGMDCNIIINKLNWETPLLYACKTRNSAVVKLMIENYKEWGVDCNRMNGKGQNVLMIAMEVGQVDLVKMLVDKSRELELKLNAYDLDENTALMIGSQNKQNKAIKMLFERDKKNFVDPNWRNKLNQTAFILACQPTHNENKDDRMINTILEFLGQPEIKRIDFKAKDDNGKTATYYMTTKIKGHIKLSHPELF